MIGQLINKIKGWWHKMFDYNKIVRDFNLDLETSADLLKAIEKWSNIYNGNEPWSDQETKSLHVAKTMSEKVAGAVVNEYKSYCSDNYINSIYQKFLSKVQDNTELMIGKSCIFFKPFYDDSGIQVSVIQADKFIPVKFDDSGKLLGCITIDQITKENDVYTRLEYSELISNKMVTKNIAYKGKVNGIILETRINVNSVDKWSEIDEQSEIEGIDRIIGGFATMPVVNTIDNNSPIGMPIWFNALETLEEIDKQFSRIIWEFEGTELAVDVDVTTLPLDKKGNPIYPKGKERLFRLLSFDDTKDKTYNVFSPEIRENPLFNGLNEYLRLAEVQCHLEHGTLSKAEISPKTAAETNQRKQTYYTTVSNIQRAMQNAFDDLVYGIYVLCKIYGIPVGNNYEIEHDWDDSILVDKESARTKALLDLNNGITSKVQYIMETRNMKEKEAIEFIQRQEEYRKLTETPEEQEPPEEE